jgi:hypothetical protein
MEILLFSTSDMRGNRTADLHRLLQGLAKEPVVPIHFILLQGVSTRDINCIKEIMSPRTRLLTVPHRIPLSMARNLLLQKATEEKAFDIDGIAAFPDDDAFYPDHLLPAITDLFTNRPYLDLFTCRNSLNPQCHFDSKDLRPVRGSDLVRRTSSNTIFLRTHLVKQLGSFDERLGLGTPAGGGEDTEYVLRAALAARKALSVGAPLVGHPPSDLESATRYYYGSTIAIARHAPYRISFAKEFIRKLAVGAYHAYTAGANEIVRSILFSRRSGTMPN